MAKQENLVYTVITIILLVLAFVGFWYLRENFPTTYVATASEDGREVSKEHIYAGIEHEAFCKLLGGESFVYKGKYSEKVGCRVVDDN